MTYGFVPGTSWNRSLGGVRRKPVEVGRSVALPRGMSKCSPFAALGRVHYIRLAVMMCVRLPLSLRNVEDLPQ